MNGEFAFFSPIDAAALDKRERAPAGRQVRYATLHFTFLSFVLGRRYSVRRFVDVHRLDEAIGRGGRARKAFLSMGQ